MGEKLPRCCARRVTQVQRARGEVRSAAQNANRWPDSPVLQARIAKAKAGLAQALESQDEHMHDDTLEHS